MENIISDIEEERHVDRIRALAWKEARDSGATFITRKWVARKLRRSLSWVKRTWKKTYDDCKHHGGAGRPESLSQGTKDVILEASHQRKRGSRTVAKEVQAKRGRRISRETVRLFAINWAKDHGTASKSPRKVMQTKRTGCGFVIFSRTGMKMTF